VSFPEQQEASLEGRDMHGFERRGAIVVDVAMNQEGQREPAAATSSIIYSSK
jgi:hypothetical protein